MRASLYAGVALPAHIRLDVVSTPDNGINVHDVRRTDINALAATIAASHIDESRHIQFLFVI
jgi:hypothetical protein